MPRTLNYTGQEGTYGRWTGLGNVPCSDVQVPPGFVGPIDCDPTNGGPVYPVGQNQISAIWDYIDSMGYPSGYQQTSSYPSSSNSVIDGIKNNWQILVVGAAALLLIKRR